MQLKGSHHPWRGETFWLCLLWFHPQGCKQALTPGSGSQSNKLPALLWVSYLWAADKLFMTPWEKLMQYILMVLNLLRLDL